MKMIFKGLSLFVCSLLAFFQSYSQDIRIRYGALHTDVTGDTIVVQAVNKSGWAGYESLNLHLEVYNSGSTTKVVGAKKMPLDSIQPDVSLTFCFAGQCYAPYTFVSPFQATMAPLATDSSFLAYYMFDNTVHTRGINYVAYIFYDYNSPSDSSVVFVKYDTRLLTGMESIDDLRSRTFAFPNPSSSELFIHLPFTIRDELTMDVYDPEGKLHFVKWEVSGDNRITIDATGLPSGTYYYKLSEKHGPSEHGKFVIAR